MYEKLLMHLCFAGLAVLVVVWFLLHLKEADARPMQNVLARLRKESPVVRFLLPVFLAVLIVYGSTKQDPPDGGSPARTTLQRRFDNGFTESECAAGYALWHVGTNETWNFACDGAGVEIGNWKKRGAFKDRTAFLGGGYPFVCPDGVLDFEDMQVDALGRALGVVPEANWGSLPGPARESLAWMATNAFGDVLVTWRNPLLERNRDAPVSVQTRVSEDGDVFIAYDLNRAPGDDEVFSARLARNGAAVGTNFNSQVTSLRFYRLRPEDSGEIDPDGDGIPSSDEVKRYHTDPRLADTDGDGLGDGDEVRAGTDPNVRSVPDELILARVLASPTNQTYACVDEIDYGHLRAVKLWDGFAANRTNAVEEVLFERTVPVGADNGWRECFLSSRPATAGAWKLEGLVLEWRDGSGTWRSAMRSDVGDSLDLALAEGTASVTVRLKATGAFLPQDMNLGRRDDGCVKRDSPNRLPRLAEPASVV